MTGTTDIEQGQAADLASTQPTPHTGTNPDMEVYHELLRETKRQLVVKRSKDPDEDDATLFWRHIFMACILLANPIDQMSTPGEHNPLFVEQAPLESVSDMQYVLAYIPENGRTIVVWPNRYSQAEREQFLASDIELYRMIYPNGLPDIVKRAKEYAPKLGL